MDLKLVDKVALVTGGSKGIGGAITRALLAEGARVANVNRSTQLGLELQEQHGADRCCFIQADLSDDAACERAVTSALQHFGRIDVVVNNAGVNDGVGLDAGVADFRASLQRNLVHYYAMVHYCLASLKQHRGVVINIGSKVCDTGQGGTSGYAAAKGGINGLTREWAVDLAPSGVRVNAVIPAETWTPLYEKCVASLGNPEVAKQEIQSLIPLGRRFTTSDEIAAMAVFLASERSSHTTGQIIYVDGGYTHLDRKCTQIEGGLNAQI